MRMISVDGIDPGMVLGRSIYSCDSRLLLGAGYRITQEYKRRLGDLGYSHVYVMEEGTEDIVPEDIISDELKVQARSQLANKAEEIVNTLKHKEFTKEKIFTFISYGYLRNTDIINDIRPIVEEIVNEIAMVGSTTLNSLMLKTHDSFNYDHAINTSVLAVLIAKRYGFSKDETINLAVGTFLHDFGKIVIDCMKTTRGKKLAEELEQEHPTFGYLLVHNSKHASPMICQVINQHHEFQDGTGFPCGLRGENLPPISTVKRSERKSIYRLAEICTVVDAYDNYTLNPNSGVQNTPARALRELIKEAGTKYNRHIVNKLTRIIQAYPIGAEVKIVEHGNNNLVGSRGYVAKTNELEVNRPTILILHDRFGKRIKPQILDTSSDNTIGLELML